MKSTMKAWTYSTEFVVSVWNKLTCFLPLCMNLRSVSGMLTVQSVSVVQMIISPGLWIIRAEARILYLHISQISKHFMLFCVLNLQRVASKITQYYQHTHNSNSVNSEINISGLPQALKILESCCRFEKNKLKP